jgi:hypothetical protein
MNYQNKSIKKNKFSSLVGFIISVLICFNLTSCTNTGGRGICIIYYKSLVVANPHLSYYCYTSNGIDIIEIIDSTTRYNIGDDVRKYSTKK